MGNCKTCANALFNQLWGDWKCKISGLYCYDPSKNEGCEDYKQGVPAVSKEDVREEE